MRNHKKKEIKNSSEHTSADLPFPHQRVSGAINQDSA
jgi:hypothetical protein